MPIDKLLFLLECYALEKNTFPDSVLRDIFEVLQMSGLAENKRLAPYLDRLREIENQ